MAQVHEVKAEKGEDWEHEDEHADDDLEQGEEEGSDQENTPAGAKRCLYNTPPSPLSLTLCPF